MNVPGASVTVFAPAKINLALAVGAPVGSGPKAGFHPIASWFVGTSLRDRVRVTARSQGTPSEYVIAFGPDAPKPSPIDWPVEKDLCVKAHRLLERETGRELPVRLELTKMIPVGGGLGGGSSDAAGALVAVDRLFGLGLGAARLRTLSEQLGSDIAFFIDDEGIEPEGADQDVVVLRPRPALVTGFGEKIERLPRRPLPRALLLAPAFGCPTGAVYKAFDELLALSKGKLAEGSVIFAVSQWMNTGVVDQRLLSNSLENAACHVNWALERALINLRGELNVPVHVTGSGSTMFILYSPGVDLTAMARRVAQIDPTIVCVPVELV